jgi:lipopolysaccharide export LptBFGC system permease protein LptF
MKQSILILPIFLFSILIAAISGCAINTTSPKARTVEITSIREEVKEDSRKIMTEAELQSQVMSFADRFASRILPAGL